MNYFLVLCVVSSVMMTTSANANGWRDQVRIPGDVLPGKDMQSDCPNDPENPPWDCLGLLKDSSVASDESSAMDTLEKAQKSAGLDDAYDRFVDITGAR